MIVPLLFGTLFLASPLLMKRAYLKAYRGNPTYRGVRSLILNEGDLEFNGPTYSSQLKWQHFLRFVEDEKVFLLYQSTQAAQIIPKRELSPEQISELREALTRNVAAKN